MSNLEALGNSFLISGAVIFGMPILAIQDKFKRKSREEELREKLDIARRDYEASLIFGENLEAFEGIEPWFYRMLNEKRRNLADRIYEGIRHYRREGNLPAEVQLREELSRIEDS